MRLIIHQEAESTQDLAREWAIRGEPEGLAIMALNQTKGRGNIGPFMGVSPREKPGPVYDLAATPCSRRSAAPGTDGLNRCS